MRIALAPLRVCGLAFIAFTPYNPVFLVAYDTTRHH
jgi:hypothetical protein